MTADEFPTKTAHAADAIRWAVVAGEIGPGERVRVEDWAHRLGLSLTPVREALRALEAQGVVTIPPHQGARVRASLARLAVDMVRESDAELAVVPAEARDNAERFAAASAAGDPAAAFEGNDDFHETLYAAAAVPKLLERPRCAGRILFMRIIWRRKRCGRPRMSTRRSCRRWNGATRKARTV